MNRTIVIVLAAAMIGVASAVLIPLRFGADGGDYRADPKDEQQVARGRLIYEGSCASCHGANLEGAPDWKTPLEDGGYPAPPHDVTGHTWHHPDSLLFKITKHGGQSLGAGIKSNMPGFEASLTDEQIWAALAYIKSSWPEEVVVRQAANTAQADN